MARGKNVRISLRKQPRQTRSTRLVADILEAAARVLTRDGAHRFTTGRVAEAAGVSVGSLYQYFPNKEAILFRLQSEEWRQTMDQLRVILRNTESPPLERLRSAVRAFFLSECEEAAFRTALEQAAPLYREAPESQAHAEEGRRMMNEFMEEVLPRMTPRECSFAADLVGTVMSAVGKAISSQNRTPSDVEALALAVSDMVCGYLERYSLHDAG